MALDPGTMAGRYSVPTIHWWLGLSTGEQAAWAAVWVAAIVGLLAAFGSVAAAWASFGAARRALDIAEGDRQERTRERNQDAADANFRATLLLQPAIANLVACCELAIDKIKIYREQGRDQWMGMEGFDSVETLSEQEIRRIGNMHDLARNVSGELGENALRTMAYARETASVIQAALHPQGGGLHILPLGSYDELQTQYAILLTYARRAREIMEAIDADQLEVDPQLLPAQR